MVGRIRFALERAGSPRHSSHVAQLFSLGIVHAYVAELHFWDALEARREVVL